MANEETILAALKECAAVVPYAPLAEVESMAKGWNRHFAGTPAAALTSACRQWIDSIDPNRKPDNLPYPKEIWAILQRAEAKKVQGADEPYAEPDGDFVKAHLDFQGLFSGGAKNVRGPKHRHLPPIWKDGVMVESGRDGCPRCAQQDDRKTVIRGLLEGLPKPDPSADQRCCDGSGWTSEGNWVESMGFDERSRDVRPCRGCNNALYLELYGDEVR